MGDVAFKTNRAAYKQEDDGTVRIKNVVEGKQVETVYLNDQGEQLKMNETDPETLAAFWGKWG